MSDQFENFAGHISAPATRAMGIVPHDSNALSQVPRAIYVGTGGTIVMRGATGTSDQTWKNVPSGGVLPFRASHVRATGTSAADLLALY